MSKSIIQNLDAIKIVYDSNKNIITSCLIADPNKHVFFEVNYETDKYVASKLNENDFHAKISERDSDSDDESDSDDDSILNVPARNVFDSRTAVSNAPTSSTSVSNAPTVPNAQITLGGKFSEKFTSGVAL